MENSRNRECLLSLTQSIVKNVETFALRIWQSRQNENDNIFDISVFHI